MFKHSYSIVLFLSVTLYGSTSLAAALVDKSTTTDALMDPMRPPSAAPDNGSKGTKHAKASGFQLSAIRIAHDQRSAILNGKTVSVGERLGSARVTAIQASSITLQQDGKTVTVSLLPLSIKKPVEAPQP